ncbi:MAG: Ig-like domain-containing protein, partial [Chloroflexota bacterium]
MSWKNIHRLIIPLLLLALVLGACRREEEEPTPEPTSPPTSQPAEVEVEASPAVVEEVAYDWPPQLVYSSPEPGEEVMLDGSITLRFDQPMDEASVEEAFQITPAGETSPVEGMIQWPRPDTMLFTPAGQLERQQVYDVTVADTAASRGGQPLRQEVNLQLETIGFLEVSQSVPLDGADEVQTDAAITVAFNRPVVPLVTTGQQADLPQPLSFEPEIAGTGEWTSTSIYRFEPEEPLAGATTYRVTVEGGLMDVTGGELAEDVTFSFTTLSPSVVQTMPARGDVRVSPVGPYTVEFNMPMDEGATETALSLSPAAPLSFEWGEGSRVVTMTTEASLERGADYELNIAASATSASGGATLDRGETIPFTVALAPAVVRTEPADGAQTMPYQLYGTTVLFTAPMDPDTLEDQVLIQPEPDDVDYNFYDAFNDGAENFNMFLGFDLERDTEYVITIPATATDIWGESLGEAYTYSFTTPPPDPLVSLNLPNQPEISQLSTSFPTAVDVIYRNVSRIDAQLWDEGLPVERLLQFYVPPEFQPQGTIVNEWSIPVDLPQNEVGVLNLELAGGGTLPTGVYYVSTTGPEIGPEQSSWQNQDNMLIVADTNLVVKQTFENVYVWATTLATGLPAAGLELTLYDFNGREVGTATTDSNGLASFAYEQAEDYLESVLVVSNAPGEEGFGVANSNWNRAVTPWEFGLRQETVKEPERFAYLYTDRPIYRPGDTVFFKGIVRDTDYGRYPLPTNEDVSMTMLFLNDYSEIDFQFETTVDENGEFSGEYQIPEDAALGNYRMMFSTPDSYAERDFAVAEYRTPEFQVTAVPSSDELLRGEPNEVVVEATYFFGGSASDLNVNWNVFADRYRLPWEGAYYAFGDDANFFYEPSTGPFRFGGGTFGETVLSGSGTTDADGRLVIELPADLLDELDPGSRTVTVQADVLDITNFPITGRAEIIYHAAETYVGVRAGDSMGVAGTEAPVEVITVDWESQPAPNTEVEVVFYQRNWEPIRDRQFGQPFTRWEAIDTEVDRATVTTDDQGQAGASFVPQDGGSYIAVATATDAGGREHTSSTFLWVADENFVGWRTDPREKRMDLVADQREYQPGDVARILVQSPFEGPAEAWLTIERGNLLEQEVITLETNSDILEIPITSNFAPNVFVTVAVVKGIDESNPVPDMRLGMTELIVDPVELGLNVSLTPQRELLEPGETATYDVQITNFQGQPVQASFSLALVDLAVLSLLPDNAPPIHEAFYSRQPLRSNTGSGLIQSGEGLEIEIPEMVPGLGGGGDGLQAVSAPGLQEEDEARREFPDTAFWEAKVETGGDGRATVEIPLPDSLTTWRLSSKAVSNYNSTGDTLVGQGSTDVVATLPLLIRPVTPRFFVVGDTIQLGAAVHNNTGADQEVTVSLEADGLTIEDDSQQIVTVPDGERALVRWTTTVDDVPFADLTFRAQAGEFSDATKPLFGIPPDQLVPVVRYAGEDFVGTSGVLEESDRVVEAILLPETVDERQGEVQVTLSASLAAALIEALEATDFYLEESNFCAPTVADQLLPNAATALALGELDLEDAALQSELDGLIQADIRRLTSLQLGSGGWGWCYSSRSEPFLTAYILFALVKAEQAGYEVPERVIERAAGSVGRALKDVEDLNERSDVNAQAFYLYVLSELGEADPADLDALYEEHRSLMDPYAKALLALAYELT